MVDALKKVGIDLYLENYEATVMYSSWLTDLLCIEVIRCAMVDHDPVCQIRSSALKVFTLRLHSTEENPTV